MVWSIPAMVVILLAAVAWTGSHLLDPGRTLSSQVQPLRVTEVVSLDWKWLFIYPEQRVATVNELVVPAGTPIEFNLTSASVMNAFFVPQLGTQIYTMPGMTTRLNLLSQARRVSIRAYPPISAGMDFQICILLSMPCPRPNSPHGSPEHRPTAPGLTPMPMQSSRAPAAMFRRSLIATSIQTYSVASSKPRPSRSPDLARRTKC